MITSNKLVSSTNTLNDDSNQHNLKITSEFFHFVTSNSEEGTVIWQCPWRHVENATKWHKDIEN
jgi:hypothetical protein